MMDFFRFPHIPHLAWLGEESPRDDKVLSLEEAKDLLSAEVVVEEKLDGANLGISISKDGKLLVQNRGQYLVEEPFSGQFSRLSSWIAPHRSTLLHELTPGLILFGEWCAARHSIQYHRLPDWFVVFDVYDTTTARFWSITRRNFLAGQLGMPVAPCLFSGPTSLAALKALLADQRSMFGDGPIEGIVIRREEPDWLTARAKLVRAEFTQAIDGHWSRRAIEWNSLGLQIQQPAPFPASKNCT